MRIAILETGRVPPAIRSDFPGYPEMFRRLLAPAAPHFQFTDITMIDAAPPSPDQFDGYLITGSPAGVYEDHLWLAPLFEFIRDAASQKKPQIGICFGHQAIAHAFGGEVKKSEKGWGLGRHEYNVLKTPDWLTQDAMRSFALSVSHQDQIVAPPGGAVRLAASEFTPFASVYYPDAPALSFQGHPEFDDDYSAALYNVRRNNPLTDAEVDAAITSLSRPEHNKTVAHWMVQFYTCYC